MTDLLILLIIVCAYCVLTALADKRQIAQRGDLLSSEVPIMSFHQYSVCGCVTDAQAPDTSCARSAIRLMSDAASGSALICADNDVQDVDHVSSPVDNGYMKPVDF